jgi:hypothetical protein
MFSFFLLFLVSRENLKLEDPRLLEFILENSRIVMVSNVICSYYRGLVVGSTSSAFPTLEQISTVRLKDINGEVSRAGTILALLQFWSN